MNLNRFLEHNIDDAIKELKAGQKKTHWIWWTFPQLKGLGNSQASIYYGLENLSEAKEFLANPILNNRLETLCEILLSLNGDINYIMGSRLDAMKLHASMTLFFLAAPTDNNIFGEVINKFFNDNLHYDTLAILKKGDYK